MAKKQDNTALIVLGAIIVVLILNPGGIKEKITERFVTYSTIETKITEAKEGECSLSLSKYIVNPGELVRGTINDGIFASCDIYVRFAGVWTNLGTYTTDDLGIFSYETNALSIPGTYEILAICTDTSGISCKTNTEILTVNTPEVPDTPEVGDPVGGGSSGSGNGNFGDDFTTSPIIVDWILGGGPYLLGARITRSWNYIDPECTGPEQYPMEWTFYDSNGMAWQNYPYDYVPVNNVVAEVCPVTYHEDNPWTFIVSVGIQNCEVEYSWSIEPYICGKI